MTYAAVLTREEFINWLGRKLEPSPRKFDGRHLTGPVEKGRVVLIWEELPKSPALKGPPPLVAVPAREMREFFAFVGTYVSTYQPFSAFFRVISQEEAPELLDVNPPSPELRNMLVGTLIAEAWLQAGNRLQRPADLSVQGCLATMSSAAVSGLTAGFGPDRLNLALARWFRTRGRFSEEQLQVEPDRIRDFWELVAEAYTQAPRSEEATDNSSRRILQFVSELIRSEEDEIDPKSWAGLVEGLPSARSALVHMRESREDRVRAIDAVMADILGVEQVDSRIREVALGYLASRVAGGSMSYLSLLDPVVGKLPSAFLWFGFFVSLRSDTDVMNVGDCLGRRLARHLTQTSGVFEQPDADVSFEELEAMAPDGHSEIKFRTDHPGIITVEILAPITAIYRYRREMRQSGVRESSIPRRSIQESDTW